MLGSLLAQRKRYRIGVVFPVNGELKSGVISWNCPSVGSVDESSCVDCSVRSNPALLAETPETRSRELI